MPNWSEGSLKLQGKKEDIKRFLNSFEKAKDRDNWKYIPDTLRAFFIEDEYTLNEYLEMLNDWDDPIAISLHFCQAWCVNVPDFIEISKRYNLHIRIYTVDRGLMFTENYAIINGELVKDHSQTYENLNDFYWNVPFPHLGG